MARSDAQQEFWPLVPVISFTGSSATGRMIAQAAARHLKRGGLELGGKTPHLVFDDADLNAVLPTIVISSTVSQASSA